MIQLTSNAKEVLAAIRRHDPFAEPATRGDLLRRCDLGVETVDATVAELVAAKLIRVANGARGSVLRLTDVGEIAAADVNVLPPSGPAGASAPSLTRMHREILNEAVRHQLRNPGGSATRSHIRTAVRRILDPVPNSADLNGAIESLDGVYLRRLHGSEVSYQVAVRGLMASDWGSDAISFLDRALEFLRTSKREDPSLFRYSWSALRKACGLPLWALSFAYLTVGEAQLGTGLFPANDDDWWSTPPDLDLLVEATNGSEYVAELLARHEPKALTGAASADASNSHSSMKKKPKFQIFISSTLEDLREERNAVTMEVLEMGHIPAGMENFSAMDDRGWKIIQKTIDASDYCVLVVAGRYGSVDETTGRSWTEREYAYARSVGRKVLAFIRERGNEHAEEDPEKLSKLNEFKKALKSAHGFASWRETGDLRAKVVQSVTKQIEEDLEASVAPPGWYRGDHHPELGLVYTQLKEEKQRAHDLKLGRVQLEGEAEEARRRVAELEHKLKLAVQVCGGPGALIGVFFPGPWGLAKEGHPEEPLTSRNDELLVGDDAVAWLVTKVHTDGRDLSFERQLDGRRISATLKRRGNFYEGMETEGSHAYQVTYRPLPQTIVMAPVRGKFESPV